MCAARLCTNQKGVYRQSMIRGNDKMSSYTNEIGIVIPALNPDEKMIRFVNSLHKYGFRHIIIIDDGSTKEHKEYFDEAADRFQCHILRHAVNFGKGMAIKTAFNYILDKLSDIKGVVTADCDGQHTPEDTVTCAKQTYDHPNSLILGCRQFQDKEIPFRSRFGNKLTSLVIRFLCGIRVSDSQTGLRGMSLSLIREHFASTKGERFEYETNMLIEAKDCSIPMIEFPIQTIYLENNETSHFNPLLDSIRIYKLFGKFLLSSLSSFVIDILLFYLFVKIFRPKFPDTYIWTATILARLISSVYNFTVNKNQVFQNQSKSPRVLIKYYALCITQMVVSAYGVKQRFSLIKFNESVLKSCLEIILFLISFQIQRRWVFKKEKGDG